MFCYFDVEKKKAKVKKLMYIIWNFGCMTKELWFVTLEFINRWSMICQIVILFFFCISYFNRRTVLSNSADGLLWDLKTELISPFKWMSTFQSDTWKFNHGVKVVQSPLPIIQRIFRTENKSCLMLQWPPGFPYEYQTKWIVKIYSWT
jgi:hypothetical protein